MLQTCWPVILHCPITKIHCCWHVCVYPHSMHKLFISNIHSVYGCTVFENSDINSSMIYLDQVKVIAWKAYLELTNIICEPSMIEICYSLPKMHNIKQLYCNSYTKISNNSILEKWFWSAWQMLPQCTFVCYTAQRNALLYYTMTEYSSWNKFIRRGRGGNGYFPWVILVFSCTYFNIHVMLL